MGVLKTSRLYSIHERKAELGLVWTDIVDYHDLDYNNIKKELDILLAARLSSQNFERSKSLVLARNQSYVSFLVTATGCEKSSVVAALEEIATDDDFFSSMEDGLAEIDKASSTIDTGELRVHSQSIYALVSLLKPNVMVETGVANGKSSAYILRALDKNGKGKLISIDLPQYGSEGAWSGVILPGREPGWLVPSQLRRHWDLRLGDTRILLPALRNEVPELGVFFHDSLHTYEHMTFELNFAKEWIKPGGWIFCDDIRGHAAFEEAASEKLAIAFGTFGVFRN